MALSPGTSLGPYEILGPLGAGGMGEVYRARDPRLNRDVALKVLPDGFAADADRMARLKREAQVLAALSHPNIAAIHGLENDGDRLALVLELVDGPTLAERLWQGPLAMDDALLIARQIAAALEAAHEVGIVHRDLKPANVKLRTDGTVKVLDFGLAKPLDAPGAPSRIPLDSPTLTSPALTERGVILGTAAYMSPEQAKGKPADRRSDIWSFGVVLFEMLTGRCPFRADDTSDTLAAVLRADPPWTELPPETPPALEKVLRRCLRRDASQRWQHLGDVRLELAEIAEGTNKPPASAEASRPHVNAAAWIGLAVLAATIGALIGRWSAPQPAPSQGTPVALTLTMTSGEQLVRSARAFGVSPDGRYVAYAAVRNGQERLYLRALDRPEAEEIAGTDNATYPVFSPDGAAIAFVADGWIRRVPVAGGTITSIVPAQAPRGLAWAPGDRIIFTANASSALSVVPASGGSPEPLTELDVAAGETNHRWPIVLPDGSGVLFAVQKRSRTELDIEAVSFATKARTRVRTGGFPLQILETGHLVYSAINGDTFAAPFDVQRLSVTGPAVPLPERPGYTDVPGFTSSALSPNGTMVSIPLKEPARQLVVIARDGTRRVLDVPARNYQQLKISPNGRRIAVTTLTGISEWDIWIMDTAGGPLRRVTVSTFNIWPWWQSDDTLLYSAFEGGMWKFMSRDVDRNEPGQVLLSGMREEAAVAGRLTDGSLVYTLILPQQEVFVATEGQQPRTIALPEPGLFDRIVHNVSPDGRWLSYTSTSSGQRETFLASLPEGRTHQVSRNGGGYPVWAKAGRELYFRRILRDQPDEIVSVSMNRDGSFGLPQVVARGDYVDGWATFDVFPDGSLLMMQEVAAQSPNLDVVVNWPALRGLTR